jgi:hypothetical protein
LTLKTFRLLNPSKETEKRSRVARGHLKDKVSKLSLLQNGEFGQEAPFKLKIYFSLLQLHFSLSLPLRTPSRCKARLTQKPLAYRKHQKPLSLTDPSHFASSNSEKMKLSFLARLLLFLSFHHLGFPISCYNTNQSANLNVLIYKNVVDGSVALVWNALDYSPIFTQKIEIKTEPHGSLSRCGPPRFKLSIQ